MTSSLEKPKTKRVGAVDEDDVDGRAELVREPGGELEPAEAGPEHDDAQRQPRGIEGEAGAHPTQAYCSGRVTAATSYDV